TSVFIMSFTALTGAVSHFAIGQLPDLLTLILCMVFTLIWARIAAVIANKAKPKTLNRVTGIVLLAISAVVLAVNYIF
ncbi:MAG: sulfite exporter TauE/SafE family protein, partial [Ruminococcus sp.]